MCVLRTENISPGIRAGYTQGQGRQTESAVQRQTRSHSREHTSAIPDTSVEDDTIISTKGGHTATANTTIQHTRNPSQHKALSDFIRLRVPSPRPQAGGRHCLLRCMARKGHSHHNPGSHRQCPTQDIPEAFWQAGLLPFLSSKGAACTYLGVRIQQPMNTESLTTCNNIHDI
jgi:hypothetical protein